MASLIGKHITWVWDDSISATLHEKSTNRDIRGPYLSIDGPIDRLRLPWSASLNRRVTRMLNAFGYQEIFDSQGKGIGGWTSVGPRRMRRARFKMLLERRKK